MNTVPTVAVSDRIVIQRLQSAGTRANHRQMEMIKGDGAEPLRAQSLVGKPGSGNPFVSPRDLLVWCPRNNW
jgi:hypothetical protein